MTIHSLLSDIQRRLGSLAPRLATPAAASDIFEAYIFSIVVEAARREHATIHLLDVHGRTPTTFIFRTSPGYIGSTTRDYGYARLEFPGKPPLEAHLSVRVAGQSGVLHECDIVVLDATEAEMCRRAAPQSAIHPRTRSIRIAIECKHYISSLKLSLAREFLGFDSDVHHGTKLFVTNSSSPSVEKLLAHKKKAWEHRALPANRLEISRLKHRLQEEFKRYKAL